MNASELRDHLSSLHAASFRWAVMCCRGDQERAQDVLHDVYVKLLEGRTKFGHRSSFQTWLFGVIRNTARSNQRTKWWNRVWSLDWITGHKSLEPLGKEERPHHDPGTVAVIWQAMSNLPQRQREVTHLVFYQQMTIAQAAEVLGIQLGTARTHYERAKDNLRSQLSQLDIHPISTRDTTANA